MGGGREANSLTRSASRRIRIPLQKQVILGESLILQRIADLVSTAEDCQDD